MVQIEDPSGNSDVCRVPNQREDVQHVGEPTTEH